ncbi:MAG: recombinase family protein [Oscillospiraceae bacterium]|jgi:DNA invertase Pin-like site-specific DNA recombinase|nr:recombinase family protein [Oscillospiraceae bacterium]
MTQAETVKKAVIYARFSSHAQNEQSIEGQLRVCNEYAAREGIDVVGEYIDRAISGRSDDRPEFQRMIEDAKKRAFQYVIVYKLDRFARNRYDSAIYKHKLKQCGVKLLSAMENIGDNPESIILEAVLEASAEYYSVDLSQKIKRGRQDSAAKGKFIGGGIPLGYKSSGGALVVDEATAPIIKYAFEEYAKGTRKRDIMAALNARGYRNANGKPYGATAFQSALRSEKYVGVLEQSGVRTENGCPALIDRETWEKVQRRLDANARQGAKNKAPIEYLLSGKIFCGHCGASMQGISGTGRGGEKHYYYQCAKRRKRECAKAHEKKDFVEWYVCEQTIDYVLSPERIRQIAAAVVAEYDKEFNGGKIAEMERRIAKIDRDMSKLADTVIELPKEGRKPFYDKLSCLGMEREELEIDVSKLHIAHEIRYTEEDIMVWLKSFCRGDLFDMDFRRRLIDVFINSVYLFDDRIIIYYNIRGGKQISFIEMQESADFLTCDVSGVDGSNIECLAPVAYSIIGYIRKVNSKLGYI